MERVKGPDILRNQALIKMGVSRYAAAPEQTKDAIQKTYLRTYKS